MRVSVMTLTVPVDAFGGDHTRCQSGPSFILVMTEWTLVYFLISGDRVDPRLLFNC